MKTFRYFGIVFIVIFLTSCVKTSLSPQEIPQKVIDLSELNSRKIALEVTKSDSLTLGRQFMLFFIPWGRIELERPNDAVFNAAYSELVLNGFNPRDPLFDSGSYPTLKITLSDYSLYAYDFFFMRRISANIALSVELLVNNKTVSQRTVYGHHSIWKEFAFSKQINFVSNKALNNAVQKMIMILKSDYKLASISQR